MKYPPDDGLQQRHRDTGEFLWILVLSIPFIALLLAWDYLFPMP